MSNLSSLSLDQIETACCLQAVGHSGCNITDLCLRLHISLTSAHCVQRAVDVLTKRGLLETVESILQLTPVGIDFLSAIGIKPFKPKAARGANSQAVKKKSV